MNNFSKEKINSENFYNPSEIEKKWQKKWHLSKLYKTKEISNSKNKFYALSMFPYPSGNLHMGHVRNYVITDLIARYQMLKGKNVLHPMGWDAFGLPAENAAIDRNINPSEWTLKNISHMKKQLQLLGLSVDWDREFATCNGDYYKWTQFIFLELFKSGLVYQKESQVNWDPIDNTVLANEQVDSEGRSWRSGAIVEKKLLKQWFLKITKYAEELLRDLDLLEGWPERVRTMQENWIGKSIGNEVNFNIKDIKNQKITVFTTRIDTLFGVTYIAISSNHQLLKNYSDNNFKNNQKKFKELKAKHNNKNDIKFGFDTGLKAINPINNDEVPIWVASYVLEEYGSGAVMGVPAHDQRDFEFSKIYKIKVKQVISKKNSIEDINLSSAYEENGTLINSQNFNGLKNDMAKKKISKLGYQEGWSKENVQYRLRDWLISRQRYWGCPIPIIHCKKCGAIPVPNENLPVKLPDDKNIQSKNLNSLKNNNSWLNVECPKCGNLSIRETDTMDTFMCSSWYFLRFTSSDLSNKPFDKEIVNNWLPVDQYVGGVEHAILHLLYARFITKALKDSGLFDVKEPFNKLLTQGMVQSAAYKNLRTGKYISPSLIEDLKNPIDPSDNSKLDILFEKMSKSKYNGIDPDTVIKKYGADTARMFILFKAPPEKDLEWGDSDVEGQYRFLTRIWKLYYDYNNQKIINKDENNEESNKKLKRLMNIAIKEITNDIENNQFNTAISELMKLYNAISQEIGNINHELRKQSLTNFCLLLAPFAPHISEELWNLLGFIDSVHLQSWPKLDSDALKKDSYELVVQINGKVRDKITISVNKSEEELKKLCLESVNVKKWTKDKAIKKFIIVKGRLINLVV